MHYVTPQSRHPHRILVTGASGFIGSHLASALARSGYEVSALTRDKARCRRRLGPQVRLLGWEDGLGAQGFDAVVNLAGARIAPAPWTKRRREALRGSRIAFTERLVQSLAGAPRAPSVWVQASAVGYYGMSHSDSEMTEENGPAEDFGARMCQDWEAAATPVKAKGTRLCLMRMGLVLGRGGALPGLLLPVRLGIGGPLGEGAQPFPWIHIDDVTTFVLACLEDQSMQGAYNLVAPEQHTQASFARAACEVLHKPFWLPAPAFPLRLLGEVAQLFLDGRRIVPRRLLEASWHWRYPELKGALSELTRKSNTFSSSQEPS
ncbi:MAG TPA: TIGR01777 family oxidoreductase [Burkholderiaceae bacterium]